MLIDLTDSEGKAVVAKVECDVKLRTAENPEGLLVFYCTKNVLSLGVVATAVRRMEGSDHLWSGANLYSDGKDGALTLAEAKRIGRDVAGKKQKALRKSLGVIHDKLEDDEWPHLKSTASPEV